VYILQPEQAKNVTLHKLQEMKAYKGFEEKLHVAVIKFMPMLLCPRRLLTGDRVAPELVCSRQRREKSVIASIPSSQ
jgi:hypothetical protein